MLIIVERKEDWASYFPSEDILTAQEYLEQTRDSEPGKRVQVINLCRSYKYLGHGYYCSLLAEARGHKVIPSVRTISELTRKSLYGLALDDLDKTLEKALQSSSLQRYRRFYPDPVFRPDTYRAVAGSGAAIV